MEIDQRLDKIEEKIDKIVESVSKIDSTLAGQHISLKEHMRRTDALEVRIEQVDNSILPLQINQAKVFGIIKFITYISVIVGVIATVVQAIKILH